MGSSSEVGAIPYDKSNNVESSLFLISGRITRKDFLLRSFLCFFLWGVVCLFFYYWDIQKYNEWIGNGGSAIQSEAVQMEVRHTIVQGISFYVLPIILLAFTLIQAAKRIHDTNHSSLYLLIPLYNIYLLFSKGSIDDNDYGLLPNAETKSPLYKTEEYPKSNYTNQLSGQISSRISSLSFTPSTSNTRKTAKITHNLNEAIAKREKSQVKKSAKNTNKQNDASNFFVWVIVGIIISGLIAPWFISSIPIGGKIALVLSIALGTWAAIYAIDEEHKGKYVAALGWGGFLAIVISTIITVYGIFNGFNDNNTDNSVPVVNHIENGEINEEEIITEVSPKHHVPSTYVNISYGSSSFWIDKHEVTQKDYARLMGNNPSTFTGDSLPVHGMSVRDAVLYCNKKSAEDGCSGFYIINGSSVTVKSDGNGYRLPTMSEWKHAANSSTVSQMSEKGLIKEKNYSKSASDSRNYDSNKPHKVNERKANRNGLYDIQSNVSEFCVKDNGEVWGMGKNYRIHLDAEGFKVADNLSSTIKTDAFIGLRLVFVP